jgi:hypothetical protein
VSRIYVDSAIHRWRGQLWCHIFSPDIDALHSFMASIGSRRQWFQEPGLTPGVSWPHYDANQRRREMAIAAGAVPLDRHRTVVMSKVVRGAWYGAEIDPLEGHRARSSPLLPELETWLERELALMRT